MCSWATTKHCKLRSVIEKQCLWAGGRVGENGDRRSEAKFSTVLAYTSTLAMTFETTKHNNYIYPIKSAVDLKTQRTYNMPTTQPHNFLTYCQCAQTPQIA